MSCLIRCSWKISGGKSIQDTIVYSIENDSAELEDTVSLDTCLHLHSEAEGSEKCKLIIKCPPGTSSGISHLLVVSEARNLEIYHGCDEYLTTVKADFIDKIDDDFIIYKGNVSFPKPVLNCMIKFASLRHPNEMWLYGVNVCLKPLKTFHSTGSSMDLSNVMGRLQDFRNPLTEKAQNFMKFLHSYQELKANDTLSCDSRSSVNSLATAMLLNPQIVEAFKKDNMGESLSSSDIKSVLSKFMNNSDRKSMGIGDETRLTGLRNCSNNEHAFERLESNEATPNCNGATENSLNNNSAADGMCCSVQKGLLLAIERIVKQELLKMEDRLLQQMNQRIQKLEEQQNKQMARIIEILEGQRTEMPLS